MAACWIAWGLAILLLLAVVGELVQHTRRLEKLELDVVELLPAKREGGRSDDSGD